MSRPTVPDRLRKLADLYEAKNKEYGNAYKSVGIVFEGLGLSLYSKGRLLNPSRSAIIHLMVYKLQRYVARIHDGGHGDSLDDLAVYAMMLQEIDDDDGS